ncbi:hypothetical protein SteCoe_8995 [Stentor coeruleus]|uniref:Uncharacterized protein n=1 Tax=Stentor coeruleus TaxID=5963 RepID=A0A1R2CJ10_9CILI|nr:hypothetical protein SteCoe_8995 [Stentor coeruleus]
MSVAPAKNSEVIYTLLDDSTVIGLENSEIQKCEALDMLGSMKSIVNYFQSITTVTISSPFQGTCLQVSKDENRIYFGSRKEENIPARIGVADIVSQEIILDEGVSDRSVWTIALSKDEKYIYASGQDPTIIKFEISDLSQVDTFTGHTDEVNKLIVSEDNKWIFSSSDDSSVRMWSVAKTYPRDVILSKSDGRIYSLDLSKDQKYLVSGGSDANITIYELAYSLTNPGSVIGNIYIKRPIWAIKISPSGRFLAVGDDAGVVHLYKFPNWESMGEFSHGDRVRDIDISLDESIVVSASDNTEVKIWDTKQRYKEITFQKHTKWVKSAVIMKDQKSIISYGDDKVIMIWKIPSFEGKKTMDTLNMKVLHLWYSEKRKTLEGICLFNEDKMIISWNSLGASKNIMNISIDDPKFCKNLEDKDEIFLAGRASDETVEKAVGDVGESYTMICIYSIITEKLIRSHVIKAEMQSFYIEGEYLIIGESFKITFWKYSTLEHLETVFAHNGQIKAVITAFSNTLLFTLGADNILKKFSLDFTSENFSKELDYRDCLSIYSNSAFCYTLELSSDSQYLYIASSSKFEIIYVMNFSLIFSINANYIGIFRNLNNTLCLVHTNGMDIYSSKNFQILSQLKYDSYVDKAILAADSRYIYFLGGNFITKTQNPLKCRDLTLVGDSSQLAEFKEHINQIINGKSEKPFFRSHWLIEPFHVNLLHIYAYFNLYDTLKDSIIGEENGNRIAFINSRDEFSALSIALKMGLDESTDAIVDGLRKLVKSDTSKTALKKLVFQVFEESLVDLNLVGYKHLEKLYAEILTKEDLPSLPNFCPPEIGLPAVVNSDFFYPYIKDFNLSEEIPDFGVAVLFSKTLTRLYLTLGSSKSLDFIKSIEDCPNTNIYYTKLIQLILQEKWKGVRKYMWAQAFLYLCYIVLLCLYTSYESCRTSYFLILPFAFSGVLYLYELIFVVLGPVAYFSDFWNWVDTLRSWLMIAYSLMVWLGFFHISKTQNLDERYMLAVLLFISWIRGITYFRINASTRYLTKLLFQVLIDIVPFLIILFYSAVAFGLMFRAFDNNFLSDYFPSLTYSWLIILGNWDNPTDPDFLSLIMFFATLLNPIISLNLLIAILSDTFERVSEDEVIADGQELAGMIIEIETLMFWARNQNIKTFIHIMESDNIEEDSEENLNKLMNNMRSKVFYIKENFGLHDIARQKLKDALGSGHQDLSAKLGSLLRK